MTQHLNHFIEGASFEASDGRRMTLVDPVTEQIYGSSGTRHRRGRGPCRSGGTHPT